MMGADYVGISTLVTAVGTIIIGIVVALRQQQIKATTADTNTQVQTSNGHTIAELVEKNEARHQGEG